LPFALAWFDERVSRSRPLCWPDGVGAHIATIARIIAKPIGHEDPVDWWQRGAPLQRDERRAQ
jgi:hypothetical protein